CSALALSRPGRAECSRLVGDLTQRFLHGSDNTLKWEKWAGSEARIVTTERSWPENQLTTDGRRWRRIWEGVNASRNCLLRPSEKHTAGSLNLPSCAPWSSFGAVSVCSRPMSVRVQHHS